MRNIRSIKPLLLLGVILLIALLLRAPSISTGLPYFYNEDEAHHFNRLVEMAKNRDLNPHYFHKPSLHFYLRLPIVVLSSEYLKWRGELSSIKDITTRDRYGLARYAFSASHPLVVKTSRALSILFALLTLLLVYLTTKRLLDQIPSTIESLEREKLPIIEGRQSSAPDDAKNTCTQRHKVTSSRQNQLSWSTLTQERSEASACFAALIFALSPAAIEQAAIIGVDGLMAFGCILASYLALKCLDNFSLKRLIFLALVSGLTVSSKYNAAPIAALPLLVLLLSKKSSAIIAEPRYLLSAVSLPILAFLAGTPYLLTSLNTFYEHVSYEVWHYAVAGHVGHMQQPGFQQAKFYLEWLANSALSSATLWVALIGLIALKASGKRALVFLFFPLSYFLMMSLQKTNFTRNMLVMIPYIAILGGVAITYILAQLNKRPFISAAATSLVSFLVIVSLTLSALPSAFLLISKRVESRRELIQWAKQNLSQNEELALSGSLQLARQDYYKGISRIDPTNLSTLKLWLAGYDYLAIPAYEQNETDIGELVINFKGQTLKQRIVDNPEIKVFRIKRPSEESIQDALNSDKELHLWPPYSENLGKLREITFADCYRSPTQLAIPSSEDYCWIMSRYSVLNFAEAKGSHKRLSFEFMSPWPNQQVKFSAAKLEYKVRLESQDAGNWIPINLDLTEPSLLKVEISEIHSPKVLAISMDDRRLGIAIRNFKLLTP